MSRTFIQAVDETLHRVSIFQTATEYLSIGSTVTASEYFELSQHQNSIDIVRQMWQETVQEVYSRQLTPTLLATATIALVAAQREYALPSDFERIAGHDADQRVLRGATTGVILMEYPGGYLQMLSDQPVATDWTGEPLAWAISPAATDSIRLDREPTSAEAGWTYNIAYEKSILYTVTMATETLPFTDTVINALTPVVAEGYKAEKNNTFSPQAFQQNIIRALTMNTRNQPRARYGVRRGG